MLVLLIELGMMHFTKIRYQMYYIFLVGFGKLPYNNWDALAPGDYLHLNVEWYLKQKIKKRTDEGPL